MPQINRQWLIAGNPKGRPLKASDFKFTESRIPELNPGEVLIKLDYLEFTPSLKGQMENRLSYASKTQFGEVMRGRGIGRVIKSNSDKFQINDIAHGYLGWQDYAVMKSTDIMRLTDDKYARLHLGPLGSTGMAAYFGLFEAGQPKKGDTIIISGAAGAVGSMVGQMAKISGCKVIGVTGGSKKCQHLIENLKLDGAIDYKSQNLFEEIERLAPNGVDVVFDNVGGDFLEAALGNLAINARIVICGAITRYQTNNPPPGPKNYFQLVHKRATMRGILSPDFKEKFPEARTKIREWLDVGQFLFFEDIQDGLENAPETFMRLFSGKNIGKQLLKL